MSVFTLFRYSVERGIDNEGWRRRWGRVERLIFPGPGQARYLLIMWQRINSAKYFAESGKAGFANINPFSTINVSKASCIFKLLYRRPTHNMGRNNHLYTSYIHSPRYWSMYDKASKDVNGTSKAARVLDIPNFSNASIRPIYSIASYGLKICMFQSRLRVQILALLLNVGVGSQGLVLTKPLLINIFSLAPVYKEPCPVCYQELPHSF